MQPISGGGARRILLRSWKPRQLEVSILLVSVLVGCNFAPSYAPLNLVIPAEYKEVGPWKAAKPEEALPRGAWWAQYGDHTLDTLEAAVDDANPDLAAAVAAYDQARAFAAEANSSLFPTITAADSNTYNRQSNDRPLRGSNQPNEYAANSFGGEINYELDFWGRIRNRIAAGQAQAKATAANLATARLRLRTY